LIELRNGLEAIRNTLGALEEQIDSLGVRNLAWLLLEREPPKGAGPAERVVCAIGYLEALLISARGVARSVEKSLEVHGEQLGSKERQRGRPRIEARYRVALEFARLFARITGERPTYADGKHGPSGKFTPALRELFESLGWPEADISGPAKEARDAITDEDLRTPEIAQRGGISSALGDRLDSD